MPTAKQREILSKLNKDQQKPVEDYTGPAFIVAGPGSGKTHVIVSRSAYMIEDGIRGRNIMMFTFTNKAAKEIKQRVVDKIGEEGKDITMGTYHSVCSRFLRRYATHIGFTEKFSIFDTSDSEDVLKSIVKEYNMDLKVVSNVISSLKDRMITPPLAAQNAKNQGEVMLAEIYTKYQDELWKQDAMDFDDLIFYTIILFERNPQILAEIHERYHYVVADEFHDSSPRDIRLIELLGGERRNVCMILDDEQSIYAFRGSDIEAVLNVQNRFPGLKQFVLQENYRSTQMIINAARSVIAHNKNQIEKKIFTSNPVGNPVVFFEENNQAEEAARVAKIIMMCNKNLKIPHNEIAVLYRMSYLSRALEEQLLKNGIHYKMVGGTPFYCREEIKDILSYAKLLYNPYDFEAFKRAVNTPSRGIGKANLEKILEYARNTYSTAIDFLRACKEVKLSGKAAAGIQDFNSIIADLQAHYEIDSASDFLKRIIDLTEYRSMLFEKEEPSKAEDRLANLVELLGLASSFDSLEELIQNTSLDMNPDDDTNESEKVQLMTKHSSKGLEYKVVIIIGAEEGITPHARALMPKQIEEERRLFYVAMTRAEEYLFITRAKTRAQQGYPVKTTVSRFINEIDKKYIQKY